MKLKLYLSMLCPWETKKGNGESCLTQLRKMSLVVAESLNRKKPSVHHHQLNFSPFSALKPSEIASHFTAKTNPLGLLFSLPCSRDSKKLMVHAETTSFWLHIHIKKLYKTVRFGIQPIKKLTRPYAPFYLNETTLFFASVF